jgi:hypothetical protein
MLRHFCRRCLYYTLWFKKGSPECERVKSSCVDEYRACYGYAILHLIQKYGPPDWFDKWPGWSEIGRSEREREKLLIR